MRSSMLLRNGVLLKDNRIHPKRTYLLFLLDSLFLFGIGHDDGWMNKDEYVDGGAGLNDLYPTQSNRLSLFVPLVV